MVNFDTNSQVLHWYAEVGEWVSGRYEIIDKSISDYAMKGSSLEASFPLEPIKKHLGAIPKGGCYYLTARTGYTDNNDRWVEGDRTETMLLTF